MSKPNLNLSEWVDNLPESELMSISLGELIESTATKFPETEALVYSNQPDVEDIRWTYKDLNDMSTKRNHLMSETIHAYKGYYNPDARGMPCSIPCVMHLVSHMYIYIYIDFYNIILSIISHLSCQLCFLLHQHVVWHVLCADVSTSHA